MTLPLRRYSHRVIGQEFDWPFGGNNVTNEADLVVWEYRGKNDSINHRKVDGRFTKGGPWTMHQLNHYHNTGGGGTFYRPFFPGKMYEGEIACRGHPYGDYFDFAYLSSEGYESELRRLLDGVGAKAYNLMRPDKPEFKGFQAIFELKDGLPGVKSGVHDIMTKVLNAPKRKLYQKRFGRQAGDYYLATEFGWLPILNDLISYVNSFASSKKRLNQLLRDEGRTVRRSLDLSELSVDDSSVVKGGSPYGGTYTFPSFVSQAYQGGEWVETTYKHSRKAWAEAKFHYYLPIGVRDNGWRNRLLRKLQGNFITPSTAYALTPWSFLLDYFIDVGTLFDSLSPGVTEECVCDSYYIMCEDHVSVTTSVSTNICRDPFVRFERFNCSTTTESIIKMRVDGNIYGFGPQTTLSPKQLAIIGALALSRL